MTGDTLRHHPGQALKDILWTGLNLFYLCVHQFRKSVMIYKETSDITADEVTI